MEGGSFQRKGREKDKNEKEFKREKGRNEMRREPSTWKRKHERKNGKELPSQGGRGSLRMKGDCGVWQDLV